MKSRLLVIFSLRMPPRVPLNFRRCTLQVRYQFGSAAYRKVPITQVLLKLELIVQAERAASLHLSDSNQFSSVDC